MRLLQDLARIKQKVLRGENPSELLKELELTYRSHPFAPVLKKLRAFKREDFSTPNFFRALRKFYRAYLRAGRGEDVSPYQEFLLSLGSKEAVSPESGHAEGQSEPVLEEVHSEERKSAYPETTERVSPVESGEPHKTERSDSRSSDYVPLWKKTFLEKKLRRFIVLCRGGELVAVPFRDVESFVADPSLSVSPFSKTMRVCGMIFRNALIPVIDLFPCEKDPRGVVVLNSKGKLVGLAFDDVVEEVQQEFTPSEDEIFTGSSFLGDIDFDGKKVKVVNAAVLDRVYT